MPTVTVSVGNEGVTFTDQACVQKVSEQEKHHTNTCEDGEEPRNSRFTSVTLDKTENLNTPNKESETALPSLREYTGPKALPSWLKKGGTQILYKFF